MINYEEGSEYSVPNGDGFSEATITDSIGLDLGEKRDLAAESMFECGSRVGSWRLKQLFDERGIRPTSRALSKER